MGSSEQSEPDLSQRLAGRPEPGDGVVGEKAIRAEQLMNTPLMIAAALTLPAVALTESSASGWLGTFGDILNWGTWLAFAIELVVMLILVPDRMTYLRHHLVLLIVVVLTPPVLPAGLQSIRAIRMLRLLRLLKLAQLSHQVFSGRGLQYAALMTAVTAVAGGSVFKAFEQEQQKLTEWEGIYWAIGTMTTLGSQYDAHTTGSQITAVVILLIGISFIAMVTGAIAHRFLNPPPAEPDAKGPSPPGTG
jgi:voltage-gated potassium channel